MSFVYKERRACFGEARFFSTRPLETLGQPGASPGVLGTYETFLHKHVRRFKVVTEEVCRVRRLLSQSFSTHILEVR